MPMLPNVPITITLTPKQLMLVTAGVVALAGAGIALATGTITADEFSSIAKLVFGMLTGLASYVLAQAWMWYIGILS